MDRHGRSGRRGIRRGPRLTAAGAPVVVWFRRDLRLHDHPALTEAVRRGGPVVALFVWDPAILRGRFESPNRIWFLRESLGELARAIAELGGSLVVRVGRPSDVLPDLARAIGAQAVLASRDYTPYGRERDRAVADALAKLGVAFRVTRGLLVHEPEELAGTGGGPARVFTPFLRRWEGLPLRSVLPAPDGIRSPARIPPSDPVSGVSVRIPADPTADPSLLPVPGEAAARGRLEGWLAAGPDHGPAAYHLTRDRLDDGAGTSRLSADLRFGLLSPVEVVTRALSAADGSEGSHRFASELAWRDFYAHVLWHQPRVAREPFLERFRELVWPGGPDEFDAWRTGRTGYPIVDAAMRQLTAAGWIPNRARMIVASFLTKDLLVDWRVGEAHFMRHLVDGDPASNLGGWQWAASVGTDAQPYFRVFNPVTQGRRFDPEGRYVRHWLPELARVAVDRVHEPWTMTPAEMASAGCRIGHDYPAPVVDHAEARLRALALFAVTDGSRGGK